MLLAVCETLAKSGDLGLHVLDLGLREAASGEPGCAPVTQAAKSSVLQCLVLYRI